MFDDFFFVVVDVIVVGFVISIAFRLITDEFLLHSYTQV